MSRVDCKSHPRPDVETLRDRFAMAALKGYLSNGEASLNGAEPTGYFVSKEDGRKWVAEWSYLMADAMMEARK